MSFGFQNADQKHQKQRKFGCLRNLLLSIIDTSTPPEGETEYKKREHPEVSKPFI